MPTTGVKISQLPVANTANADSIFVVVQSDDTWQISGQALLNFFNSNGNVQTISFSHNGVLNSSQTNLNLVAGSNISLTDLGGGTIQISAVTSSGNTFNVFSQIPSGNINGNNEVFSLSVTPKQATVWLNYPLIPNVGYTLSGNIITYSKAPQTGDNIYASGLY